MSDPTDLTTNDGPHYDQGRLDIPAESRPSTEFEREAAYIDMLYRRLDAVRAAQEQRLAEVRLAPRGGTMQSRTERDALAGHVARRLDSLGIGDLPLCFGRLDLDDGSILYIGRVGLSSGSNEPLLIDWRAPKAALFYSATAGSPEGVMRRRHFITRGRRLVDIEDDVFDVDALQDDEIDQLHGDAALLAELSRARSGHMRDIISTIQREQDAVIRSELAGTLVVQGGPGTGKTVVGLHRLAYLLYTYRNRLARNGVLMVGPNQVFLRYIEQVLPSLGETGALMATVRSFFPGVRTTRHDVEAVAELKSRSAMAELIANAIRDRERVPRDEVVLAFEGHRLVVSRELLRRSRDRGRRNARPHNEARRSVETSIVESVIAQIGRDRIAMGLPEPETEELADIRRSIRRARDFRALMERIWPTLSPEQLLNDLFGSPALVRSAARGMEDVNSTLLVRERYSDANDVPWTIEDVALLDEAAEQLGAWTSARDRRAQRIMAAQREEQVEYARSLLGNLDLDIDIDPELLIQRYADTTGFSITEQAARDRTWRFGHVVVDEAQELSPMAWRAVFRRAQNRSMTVLGDLAQSGAAWAPTRWSAVLEPFARDRWRLNELSTNYRTPLEIMTVANAVLAVAAPSVRPSVAIRSSGNAPTRVITVAAVLPTEAAAFAAMMLDELGDGRVAVLAPPDLLDDLRAALGARLGALFDATDPLGARVALLAVADAKGLEFDAVLLVEPGEIARHGPRGQNDLYVALTRPTQLLRLLHARALTPELEATVEPDTNTAS